MFHCIEATVDIERAFGTVRLWINRSTPYMDPFPRSEALSVLRFISRGDISDRIIEGDVSAHNQLVAFLRDIPEINAFQIILKEPNSNCRYGMMYYTVPFAEK